MIRETSRLAYEALVENGGLKKRNAKVYDYIYHHGPVTQKETEREFKDLNRTLGPRFAVLTRMGLIKHAGDKKCEETGFLNMQWDVTSRVDPLAIKKVTMKEKKAHLISSLRDIWRRSGKEEREDLERVANYIKETL